jgi:hypothetical protein
LLGAKAGATFARQQQPAATAGGNGWSNSYHVGLALNIYLAEFSFGGFAVQPEVLYNRKGQDGLQLNYVETPLEIVYLLNFGNVIPYVFVAPYYAFLVDKRLDMPESAAAAAYAKNDYGVKFGGGVELRYFHISASYGKGLCDVIKSEGLSSRNISAEFSLSYFFLR